MKKTIEIIGGGTVSHVRSHLALAAIAYGSTARRLAELSAERSPELGVNLHLTRMADAGRGELETVADIAELVAHLRTDPNVKVVYFNAAMCDFSGGVIEPMGLEPGNVGYRAACQRRTRCGAGGSMM